jgi:hypothetical protein
MVYLNKLALFLWCIVLFLTVSCAAGKDKDVLGKARGGGTLFEPAIREAQSCIEQGLQQQPEVLIAPKTCRCSTNATLKDFCLCGAQCLPILVFMSDGKPHDNGEDTMRALHKEISLRTSELQVKTLAFGDQADPTKLKALADAGGGEFLLALDGQELKTCFEKAAASLAKTHFR